MDDVINNVSKNEDITFNNELINEVILFSENRNQEKLNKLIEDLHPADLADLLTFLNSEQRSFTLSILDEEKYTNVLTELDDTIIDETIQRLEDRKVIKSISEMETDDAVNLIESLEPEAQKKILDQVTLAEREVFQESLNYPEDSAGRRMQKEFVSMPAFWSVGQTIDYLREESNLPDDFFEIFIVDPLNKPLGSVSVSKVLRSARVTQLNDILDDSPKFIKASILSFFKLIAFLKHIIASSLSSINFFIFPKLLYASEKFGFNSIALLNEKIAP